MNDVNCPTMAPNSDEETSRLHLPGSRGEANDGLFLLHVLTGGQAGREFPITHDGFVLGRSSDASLILDDSGVSRKHACFNQTTDGLLTVSDLGSTNGTFVNQERVDSKIVAHGDLVSLGGAVSLQVHLRRRVQSLPTDDTTSSKGALSVGKTLVLGPLERIALETTRAMRASRPMHLALIEVELPSGQESGSDSDVAYQLVKKCLSRHTRATDFIGRFDSDLIFIIVGGHSEEEAAEKFSSIHTELDSLQLPVTMPDGFDQYVRPMSYIGYVALEGSIDTQPESLVSAARRALESAKKPNGKRLRKGNTSNL